MNKNKKIIFSIATIIGILGIAALATFTYKSDYFEGNLFRLIRQTNTIQKIEPVNIKKIAVKPKKETAIDRLKPDISIPKIEILELTIEQKLAIANVHVMTIPADDSSRSIYTGNVDMGQFITKFYQSYEDDFDMLFVFGYDTDDAHGRGNGVSDGFFIKDVPANLGKVDYCGTSLGLNCDTYPEKLKYIQQLPFWNYTYDTFPTFSFLHEVGHYWGVGWHQAGNDQCYTTLGMAWVNQLLENGHWTERFQAGNTSTLTYQTNFLEARDPNNPLPESTIWKGGWIDNGNGTFTKNGLLSDARREGLKFNNVDLYAMGLMSAAEISQTPMFLVLNPQELSKNPATAIATYSGTRMNLTLDDIQNLLHARGTCEGIGPNYYYTGNGDRDMQGHPEFSNNIHIGIVLIQYPDNPVTESHAYHLCKIVNEEVVNQWNNATLGRSEINVALSTNTQNPDCEALFPGPAANYTPITEIGGENQDNDNESTNNDDVLELLR